MARPTISVVIANYNRAGLIGETLANVFAQSRPPDETIVIDDGSSDASVEVVAGFGDRVRLIRQDNRGPGAARNRGLAESRSELVQFMDSDDLWSLNKLEAQADALAASGADLAYSPWLQARLEGGRAHYADPVLQQRALPATRSPLAWFLRGWVTVFQACLFRRSLLDAAGPYREDLMIAEDSELLFRILKVGARPVHVPETVTLYRLHGAQISRGGIAETRRARDWLAFVTIVERQLGDAGGIGAGERRRWRETVRQAADSLIRAGAASPAEGPPASGPYLRAAVAWRDAAVRIRRRLRGSPWSTPYGDGPLTAAQAELLGAIGYDALRASRGELEAVRSASSSASSAATPAR